MQKSKQFPNFYENIKEANARLKDTLVLYDGVPHFILAVTDHKPDGIFRVYCYPTDVSTFTYPEAIYASTYNLPESDPNSQGRLLDKYLEANPGTPLIRKMMNSPKFNKFRPFPLGMCNMESYSGVVFLERSPMRPHMQQGLTDSMVCSTLVGESANKPRSRVAPPVRSKEIYDTVIGNYPSAEECFKSLKTPGNINSGAAFDRNFALLKGTLGIIFLAYKHDVVGFIPTDLSKVVLGKSFDYLVESIQELNVFDIIEMEG